MSPADLRLLQQAASEAEAAIPLCTTRESHIRAAAHAQLLTRIIANVYGYPPADDGIPDTMSA